MLKSKFNLRLHLTMVILPDLSSKNLNSQGWKGPQRERRIGWPCGTLALKHVANRLEDYHICHQRVHIKRAHLIQSLSFNRNSYWAVTFYTWTTIGYYGVKYLLQFLYPTWLLLWLTLSLYCGHWSYWRKTPSLGHILTWRYHLQLWSYSGENHPHWDLSNQALNWHLWSYSGETLSLGNGISIRQNSQNWEPIQSVVDWFTVNVGDTSSPFQPLIMAFSFNGK